MAGGDRWDRKILGHRGGVAHNLVATEFFAAFPFPNLQMLWCRTPWGKVFAADCGRRYTELSFFHGPCSLHNAYIHQLLQL